MSYRDLLRIVEAAIATLPPGSPSRDALVALAAELTRALEVGPL